MRQCSRLTTAMLAMGFIGFATISQAATTITAVKVSIGPQTPSADASATATYCSIGAPASPGPTCDVYLWNLAGLALTPGDKLILTQTGTLGPNEPNFDTSDRFKPGGSFKICAPGTECTTKIWVDSGAGLTLVYTSPAGGDPLNMFNDDGFDDRYEAADWQAPVFSSAAYTLSLGYADTEHRTCQSTTRDADGNCLPQAQWWQVPTISGSPGSQTTFIGSGIITTGCKPRPAAGTANCFDAGALLFTVPQPTNLVTVTQGGWGAPPHGNNPGQLLATNFAAVFGVGGVSIGCGLNQLKFTSAAAVQAFLPQGGPPGVLSQGAVNPTSRTSAGVFAGQVLALQLNVAFSDAGKLPTGLASSKIATGPLAGQTVGFVLDLAKNVIGGCTALPAFGVTSVSQLNDIVDAINNSFD